MLQPRVSNTKGSGRRHEVLLSAFVCASAGCVPTLPANPTLDDVKIQTLPLPAAALRCLFDATLFHPSVLVGRCLPLPSSQGGRCKHSVESIQRREAAASGLVGPKKVSTEAGMLVSRLPGRGVAVKGGRSENFLFDKLPWRHVRNNGPPDQALGLEPDQSPACFSVVFLPWLRFVLPHATPSSGVHALPGSRGSARANQKAPPWLCPSNSTTVRKKKTSAIRPTLASRQCGQSSVSPTPRSSILPGLGQKKGDPGRESGRGFVCMRPINQITASALCTRTRTAPWLSCRSVRRRKEAPPSDRPGPVKIRARAGPSRRDPADWPGAAAPMPAQLPIGKMRWKKVGWIACLAVAPRSRRLEPAWVFFSSAFFSLG
ncbi:hypothetical protein L1887_60228 [Cichorium endivia]|nr:hypothetical protein L1887_60228 [Cichorium endivia]